MGRKPARRTGPVESTSTDDGSRNGAKTGWDGAAEIFRNAPDSAFGDPKAGGEAIGKGFEAIAESTKAEERSGRARSKEDFEFAKAYMENADSPQERAEARDFFERLRDRAEKERADIRGGRQTMMMGSIKIAGLVVVGSLGAAALAALTLKLRQ